MTTTSGDELFARIAADPDDDGNYLVYADWLEGQGDPQGELIVLQHQLAEAERIGDEARRGQLGAALDAYMTKHRKRLFGELAAHAGIAWDFHLGFVRTIRVVPDISDERGKLVRDLLALPIARIVREVVVFEDFKMHVAEIERAVASIDHAPRLTFARKYGTLAEAVADGEAVRWFELAFREGADAFPNQLLGLPNLELLSVARTQVPEIPAAIAKLHRLRRLEISWCNALEDLPEELFGIETLSYVEMWGCHGLRNAFHMGRVNNLLAGFSRARTPSRRRVIEANLMLARDKRTAAASIDDLLAALDSNLGVVRESALRGLAKRLPKPAPLADATVALIGKTNFDKATLASRMAALGATFAPKLTDATTHVIVGEQPGGKQALVGNRTLIVEAQLVDLFAAAPKGTKPTTKTVKPANAKPAKTAKPAANTAKPAKPATPAKATKPAKAMPKPAQPAKPAKLAGEPREALRTGDDAAAAAAIAALGGTVPDALIVDLVVVAMDLERKKAREAAKKLLAVAAPPVVTKALKTHFKLSQFSPMGETKRGDRITAFCRAVKVVDPVELALLLVARGRVAFTYVFEHGTSADITRALTSRVADRTLDLHGVELDELPAELGKLELDELNVSANQLSAWPTTVDKIAGLVRLDLTTNALRTVPESVRSLRLTKLSLGRNHLRTFPAPVLAMTSLVDLSVTAQQARWTSMPDDIGALTKLERLGYAHNDLAELPASLFTLKRLAWLDLMFCTLPDKVPPGLAKLTSLRTLQLSYSSWRDRAAEVREMLPACKVIAPS